MLWYRKTIRSKNISKLNANPRSIRTLDSGPNSFSRIELGPEFIPGPNGPNAGPEAFFFFQRIVFFGISLPKKGFKQDVGRG